LRLKNPNDETNFVGKRTTRATTIKVKIVKTSGGVYDF
jgi:hypothetical protein